MDMNVVMYPEITGEEKKEESRIPSKKMTGEPANNNPIPEINTLNYTMLRSPTSTKFSPVAVVRPLRFELTGNMNRYVWSLDNKVVSEADRILIKKGEVLQLILYNGSMMRHPMHLHGHDFRLLNGQGDYVPAKNVLDIMPMETDTIEFEATETGDWFFHCHILYHMMSGMGRVFRYENSPANPEIPNPRLAQRKLFADDRKFHLMAENDFASNGNDGMVMLQNTRWSIGTEWRLGHHDIHGYETETHIGRYLGKMQWLMPFIGFDWRYRKLEMGASDKNIFGQINTKNNRRQFSLGVEYTLPLLLKIQTEIYHDGNLRIQLLREDVPVSRRMRFGFMINSDKEYMALFKYIAGKNIALTTHYDSDMGIGAGITLNY
jgi:hypothetical protein